MKLASAENHISVRDTSRSDFNALAVTPGQGAAHAFLQSHLGTVAQFFLRAGDRARDRLVHFGEDVDFLMIKSERLQGGVSDERDLAGEAGEPHPLVRALLAEF